MPTRLPIEERFWSKVHKTRSCWIWTGYITRHGHGVIQFEGRNQSAMRVAWILTYGYIFTGLDVAHQCKTPACVRPSHLALGTRSDNMRDGNHRPHGTALLPPKPPRIPVPWQERFWKYVVKTDSCWLWSGYNDRNGYGKFTLRWKKMMPAHRASWMLHHGDIPDGMVICHNCPGGDNPGCVNPAHLFLGTLNDNNQDMLKKGRYSKGTNVPAAKLTDAHVREILFLRAQGINNRELAKRYAVHEGTIGRIIRRLHWKHVDGVPEKRSYREKVTPEQVRNIRALYEQGITQKTLTIQFNLSPMAIWRIVNYRSHKNIA